MPAGRYRRCRWRAREYIALACSMLARSHHVADPSHARSFLQSIRRRWLWHRHEPPLRWPPTIVARSKLHRCPRRTSGRPTSKRYPLAAGFTVADMQPPSFTPDELLAQARPAASSRVVLIQMSFYGFDNRYMLEAIRDYPGVFSGVAVIDEHAAGAARHDARAQAAGRARFSHSIRGKQPVETWLAERRHGRDVEGRRRRTAGHVRAGESRGAGAARSDVREVSRHAGGDRSLRPHRRRRHDSRRRTSTTLCRLARHKNTHVKVSAFYALGKKTAAVYGSGADDSPAARCVRPPSV